MLKVEHEQVRRPSRSKYDMAGQLRLRQFGKPLLSMSAVGMTPDVAGVRINGVWYVPACNGESKELRELWEGADA